jgi:hypothetical protein
MDQCMGQTKRKRKTRFNKIEEAKQSIRKQEIVRAVDESREELYVKTAGDYSKRKMESPDEGRMVIMTKISRKAGSTFAEML